MSKKGMGTALILRDNPMLNVDRHGDQYVLREPHEDEAKISA